MAAAALLVVVVMQQLVWSAEAQVAVAVGTGPPPGCPDRCGDVHVPFPFGIGDGCSLPGFALTCNTTTNRPPRLMIGNTTLQVVNISLPNSTLRALDTAGAVHIKYGIIDGNGTWPGVSGAGAGGPYVVSEDNNQLLVTGCNILVTLFGNAGNVITGCASLCAINDQWAGAVILNPRDKCSGIGCCQTPIPIGRTTYRVNLTNLERTRELSGQVLEAVRIAERGWFDGVAAELLKNQSTLSDTTARIPVPVVLEWAVASTPVITAGVPQFDNASCPTPAAARKSACVSSNSKCVNVTGNYRTGYVCLCKDGYEGNPYVAAGCQDVDECKRPAEVNRCFGECINTPGSFRCWCPRGESGNWTIPGGCVKSKLGLTIGIGIGSGAGLFILALGAAFLTRKIKRQRERMLRQKFFKLNRGHLLQQLVSQNADIAEKMIITLSELEKATNNFDESRELGGGGHGTVYKGILSGLHVVAIKKSKLAIQREIDEFINEVAILSQINHRNVVKLFGCCLETEVPLLVYEFISNGTLYQHLHVEGPISLPWEDRLRIATETARALAYLHLAVAFPIIHRDIKSQNILLDGSLTTKVSDFGASRCIPAEQTGVITAIQGTLGYLDPMYYYTGRLTEKSDVYSFGVVLIELLTRKKSYSYRSQQDDSLVAHFTTLLAHDNLVDILDPQVMEEGGEEVKEVAMLAVACVKLKAEERPTMRQVEMSLESIRSSFLRQEVQHSVGKKKSMENHVIRSNMAIDGTNLETTRQYSLEEEYLLSSSILVKGDQRVMLAVACVKLKAEERSTIRQVEMSLESIRKKCNIVWARRNPCMENHVFRSSMAINGISLESTRQYSLEEKNGYQQQCPALAGDCLSGGVACTPCVGSGSAAAGAGMLSPIYPFGIGAGCARDKDFQLECINDNSNNNVSTTPRLILSIHQLQLLSLSLDDGEARALFKAKRQCYNNTDGAIVSTNDVNLNMSLSGSMAYLFSARNRLVALGCPNLGYIVHGLGIYVSGCTSICWPKQQETNTNVSLGGCNGEGCCQSRIAPSIIDYYKPFIVGLKQQDQDPILRNGLTTPCRYVFLAEDEWIQTTYRHPLNYSHENSIYNRTDDFAVPVVLDWAIRRNLHNCSTATGNMTEYACRSDNSVCIDAINTTNGVGFGYRCRCSEGYEGNPYLADGCQDIDECQRIREYPCYGECTNTPGGYECMYRHGARGNATVPQGCIVDRTNLGLIISIGVGSGVGLLAMAVGAAFLTRKIKNKRERMLRRKFFKQNRGHLLQRLVSQNADITERMIIPLAELEKATNNFDISRELGGGGHGTVYKGILSDLHVVAIKKSKVAIQREIDEFINEIAILSQINHRNVVKLFGCCLETEVPLLLKAEERPTMRQVEMKLESIRSIFWQQVQHTEGSTKSMENHVSRSNPPNNTTNVEGTRQYSLEEEYLLSSSGRDPPRLMLGNGTLQVVDISLADSTMRAVDITNYEVYATGGNGTWVGVGADADASSPYVVSETLSELLITGCNIQVTLVGGTGNVIIGCSSFCSINDMWGYGFVPTIPGDKCSGVGCCRTNITIGRPNYGVLLKRIDESLELDGEVPTSVRVAERGWFDGVANELLSRTRTDTSFHKPVPVVLEWAVASTRVVLPGMTPGNSSCPKDVGKSACRSSHSYCRNVTGNYRTGYVCRCEKGYDGNPYVVGGGGCQDINECERAEENGCFGECSNTPGGFLCRCPDGARGNANVPNGCIKSNLEKATNNFDESRELGGGGHGTVYKGILSDLHVVAIKKSKVAIQREIDEFINETEVPLLVYEFISNGTLYHHLHEGLTSLSWEDRLRIATETARSLAYLHSAVSFPIIHRDIKSHNILLDGSLTSKVSDFGASRCIPAEKNGVTTAIQGTLGYLDPMYYYTGRLTEKSDVFSFGVVLIELLTRKKPYSYKSPKDDSLVAHFTALLIDDNLNDILDSQVKEEGGKEIKEVALLAVACVKLKAEERPTMRQVEMTLETIRSSFVQEEVLHTTSMKKSKENHVAWRYPADEGTSIYSTRQYSLEEENLLSSRFAIYFSGCEAKVNKETRGIEDGENREQRNYYGGYRAAAAASGRHKHKASRPSCPKRQEMRHRGNDWAKHKVTATTTTMMIPAVSLLLVLLFQLCSVEAQVGGAGSPPARCPDKCGDVDVPFPFGIRDGCSLPGFGLTCDTATNPPRLMLGNGTLQVVEISLTNSTLRAVDLAGAVNITYDAPPNGGGRWASLGVTGAVAAGPYVVSEKRNRLVVTGCNVQATLAGENTNVITGCSSFCPISEMFTPLAVDDNDVTTGGCSGTTCCETPIAIGRPSYLVNLTNLDPTNQELTGRLPIAVRIAEKGWFEAVAGRLLNNSGAGGDAASLRTPVPVVLDWVVSSTLEAVLQGVTGGQFADDRNWSCPADAARSVCRSSDSLCVNVTGNYRRGHVCRCRRGYDGNPYVAGGCQDIDECKIAGNCFGECTNTPGDYECRCPRGARGNARIPNGCVKTNLGLSVGIGVGSGAGLLVMALCAAFLTRQIKNRRAKMLRQKFFKQNRGHLLQQLVSQKADIAEKMIIPLAELEKATNNFDASRELGGGGHGTVYKGILSDLHVVAIKKSKVAIQRETDEFINEVAILSQINHRNVVKLYGCCLETEVPLLVYEFISNGTLYHHLHSDGPTSLPWEDRLRIATETARALAYLHSAVSFPIIHRDIKSHNILLDGSLTTKVSDFGASRCIPAEKTGVTTAIQGTLGYLDPMYYYTGRLTEKSDVFSFGVVLIELLTRKKPYSYRSPKDDGLVSHFTALLTQGNLGDILDTQVKEEGGEEVKEVAMLAVACVKLKAEERPTMRQVEMTLESVRSSSLQQEVLQSVEAKKSKENHVSWTYPVSEGTSMQSTRQYSLEEEYLLSSRYPRHGVGCGRLVFPPGIGTGMIRAC
uniref:Protein kinase domain-containing protein n=1 Tax=Leersia perrieri TaxID=77586 RepID=A0A0D9XGS4_9ORYZ